MSKKMRFLLVFMASMAAVGCAMPGEEVNHNGGADIAKGEAMPTSEVQQALIYPKVIMQCSAFGHDVAACEAVCPAGYMATGGGCKTDTVYWEISESYPIPTTEGWHCMANEDFKSGVYDRLMIGYAVCIQF